MMGSLLRRTVFFALAWRIAAEGSLDAWPLLRRLARTASNSILWGRLSALVQDHLKGRLTFSTVSQIPESCLTSRFSGWSVRPEV